MNLVDWFKGMVASRRGDELVDPLIEIQPSPRSLKRALLVCLRCIDLDANKRPKMGQIIHMLEADDFPFRSVSLKFQPFHIIRHLISYAHIHSFKTKCHILMSITQCHRFLLTPHPC